MTLGINTIQSGVRDKDLLLAYVRLRKGMSERRREGEMEWIAEGFHRMLLEFPALSREREKFLAQRAIIE
jgi:hypothetical protein